jgi:hypothetical protein
MTSVEIKFDCLLTKKEFTLKMLKFVSPLLVIISVFTYVFAGDPAKSTAPTSIYSQYAHDGKTMAYYSSGLHGIAGDNKTYMGEDLVQYAGNWSYRQWFHGIDENGKEVIINSIWFPIGNGETYGGDACPSGSMHDGVALQDPYPKWGTYLKPYADYCVVSVGPDSPLYQDPSNSSI